MVKSNRRPRLVRRAGALLVAISVSLIGYNVVSPTAHAAASQGCAGGGFKVLGKSPGFSGTVAAPPGRFRIQGKYLQFNVDPANFAV